MSYALSQPHNAQGKRLTKILGCVPNGNRRQSGRHFSTQGATHVRITSEVSHDSAC